MSDTKRIEVIVNSAYKVKDVENNLRAYGAGNFSIVGNKITFDIYKTKAGAFTGIPGVDSVSFHSAEKVVPAQPVLKPAVFNPSTPVNTTVPTQVVPRAKV